MRDSFWLLKAVFFLFSRLTYREGEGRSSDRNLAETVSGRPSRQPWFSLSHCQKRKTRSIRGDYVPAEAAATAVSSVRKPDHHRPRPASQTSARRSSRRYPHSAWTLPALPQDIYHPAGLVTAHRPLQLSLPATGGTTNGATRRQLGAIDSEP